MIGRVRTRNDKMIDSGRHTSDAHRVNAQTIGRPNAESERAASKIVERVLHGVGVRTLGNETRTLIGLDEDPAGYREVLVRDAEVDIVGHAQELFARGGESGGEADFSTDLRHQIVLREIVQWRVHRIGTNP
ncbi:MAG TPA: hypothetical protein VMW17_15660 [Candidatus Binatia bacterium]|nr:hypothetical protein [Candidatus Binatia bacterium]